MTLELHIAHNDDYLKIGWSGAVPNVLPMPNPYDSIPDGSRVLVDATALNGASTPVFRWAAVASDAAARRLKIAVVSPPGLILGLFRQALLISGVDQERSIALFLTRSEAARWLLSESAASTVRGEHGP